MTRRCQWCGLRSDTWTNPERCPDCRAPWPAIGQSLGLYQQQSAAMILQGQLDMGYAPEEAADRAFVEITSRLGL